MKIRTYWYGILFIPENQRDVETLNQLPRKAEEAYEEGESEWVTEHKEFNGSRNPETNVHLPLGKALIFGR